MFKIIRASTLRLLEDEVKYQSDRAQCWQLDANAQARARNDAISGLVAEQAKTFAAGHRVLQLEENIRTLQAVNLSLAAENDGLRLELEQYRIARDGLARDIANLTVDYGRLVELSSQLEEQNGRLQRAVNRHEAATPDFQSAFTAAHYRSPTL